MEEGRQRGFYEWEWRGEKEKREDWEGAAFRKWERKAKLGGRV